MRDSGRQVTVVGAGTMGTGIAVTALLPGHQVTMIDIADERLAAGREHVDRFLRKSVQLGKLTADEREAMLGRLLTTTFLEGAAGSDVVIEAVFEDVEIKRKLFAHLDEVCGPDTLFHTNTSTLSVTVVAGGSQHPDRVVGTHYCNPAPLMSLVEVAPGLLTGEKALRRTTEYVEGLGKVALVTQDRPGFIVNRFLIPFENDCIRELEAGLGDVESIDTAVKLGLGYPMGPFTLLDIVGLDVHRAVSLSLYSQLRDARFAPPPLVERMISAGHLGRKTG
ncbi:MAG: 3-hydroxyacyl-CoA dehydrogenase family protein, partial [Acidimicrobiia bacterium]